MQVRPLIAVVAIERANLTCEGGGRRCGAGLHIIEGDWCIGEAAWGGEAQQSYDAAQRAWSKSVAEMQALLTQIAAKTEDISQQYTQSDNSSAGRFAI